jgi:chromosome partitioning protein
MANSTEPQPHTCWIIAVANNKGGVGKTTSTVAIGSILRSLGYRVLLCDLDPQANLTTHLAGSMLETDGHMGDVLAGSLPATDAILVYQPGADINGATSEDPEALTLDFIPASYQMNLDERGLQKRPGYAELLRKALRPVRPHYDFILLDTPPTLQTYTLVSLTAADGYIIPAEPEKFSYDGVQAIMEAAENVKDRLNPSLQLLGIFFTCYNSDIKNSSHKKVVEEIEKHYKEYLLPSVRKDAALVKAQINAQSLQHFAPDSRAAADYHNLTAQLLTRLG